MHATSARLPSVIAIVLSLVLVGAGAVMLIQGVEARRDVREALVAERIISAEDAAIPVERVEERQKHVVSA